MSSAPIRRVSSMVRTRLVPAGDNLPLISTSGGFPGEKNRSLIFAVPFSIAASSAGVEKGAAPDAAGLAAGTRAGATAAALAAAGLAAREGAAPAPATAGRTVAATTGAGGGDAAAVVRGAGAATLGASFSRDDIRAYRRGQRNRSRQFVRWSPARARCYLSSARHSRYVRALSKPIPSKVLPPNARGCSRAFASSSWGIILIECRKGRVL